MVRPLSVNLAPVPPDVAMCPHPAAFSGRSGSPRYSSSLRLIWHAGKGVVFGKQICCCPSLFFFFKERSKSHAWWPHHGLALVCEASPSARRGSCRLAVAETPFRTAFTPEHRSFVHRAARIHSKSSLLNDKLPTTHISTWARTTGHEWSHGQDTNDILIREELRVFQVAKKTNSGWDQTCFGLWPNYSHLTVCFHPYNTVLSLYFLW